MNNEDFQDSSSGQLIKAGADSASYRAFVPDPLPPQIALTPQLFQSLSAADRALGELAGLGRTLPNPHLLVRPFVQREAVSSSRIEGTQADMGDIYGYQARQLPLPGLGQGASEEDIREVLNYITALEYGLERLETLPLSLRLIREIHGQLMEGVRGERAMPGQFRNRQNWISSGDRNIENARFVPPPPEEMNISLNQLERYFHAQPSYPPLVRLALIHYQFEAIHPFIDGNGRIGRLLISLLTVHWNLLPLPLLYLSAYFEQNRAQYYDLLLAVSQRGAWTEWLNFFLAGVAEQAQDASSRARALLGLQDQWRERLGRQRSANVLRLANMLLARPVLTIPDAQKMLGVSYPTAHSLVEKLATVGILNLLSESNYGKLYAAEEILEILQ